MEKKNPPQVLPSFPGEKTTKPQDGVQLDDGVKLDDEEYYDTVSFPGAQVHPEGAQKIFPTPPPLSDPAKIKEGSVKFPDWIFQNPPGDDDE